MSRQPFNTALRTYPGRSGHQLHAPQANPIDLNGYGYGDLSVEAVTEAINNREARLNYLLQHGEMFWLPVALGLGTAPAAGNQFQSVTAAVDFDLAIIGADCTIFKSTIDIRDSARQRLLTNAAVPIGALADFQVSGTLNQFRNNWRRPYLLPARSQLAITTYADGSESNGVLTFYCLQPPVFNA